MNKDKKHEFISKFLALCDEYKIGICSDDPFCGLELFDITDWEEYSDDILENFEYFNKKETE